MTSTNNESTQSTSMGPPRTPKRPSELKFAPVEEPIVERVEDEYDDEDCVGTTEEEDSESDKAYSDDSEKTGILKKLLEHELKKERCFNRQLTRFIDRQRQHIFLQHEILLSRHRLRSSRSDLDAEVLEESIHVKKSHPDAIVPHKTSIDCAGFNLYSCRTRPLAPEVSTGVSTGIILEIPRGYHGRITCRAGLAFNKRIFGFEQVIEADQRTPIVLLLRNENKTEKFISKGERIGLLTIFKNHPAHSMTATIKRQKTTHP